MRSTDFYVVPRDRIIKKKNRTIKGLRYCVVVLALADIIYTALMILILFNGVIIRAVGATEPIGQHPPWGLACTAL